MRLGKNGRKTFITFPTALPLVTMFLWGICKPVNSTFLFDRNEFIYDGKRKGVVLNWSNFWCQPSWTLDGKRGIFSMRMECWTVIIYDTSFSTVTMDKSHYVRHRWAPAVAQYHVVASFFFDCPCPSCIFVSSFLEAPNYSNAACWGSQPSEEPRHREKKSKKGPAPSQNVLESLWPTWNSGKFGYETIQNIPRIVGFCSVSSIDAVASIPGERPRRTPSVRGLRCPRLDRKSKIIKNRSARIGRMLFKSDVVDMVSQILELGKDFTQSDWTFVCMCRRACHQRWKGHQGANEEDSTSLILH